jgi:hypothetical protein
MAGRRSRGGSSSTCRERALAWACRSRPDGVRIPDVSLTETVGAGGVREARSGTEGPLYLAHARAVAADRYAQCLRRRARGTPIACRCAVDSSRLPGAASTAGPPRIYQRATPERTTLYDVVRENLQTLYAAVEDGYAGAALPPFVRQEFEGYLGCGLLCRGFAHLKCEGCSEHRLVAFRCRGRGFCPSCMGRRMCQTALNLLDHVLPSLTLWRTDPGLLSRNGPPAA